MSSADSNEDETTKKDPLSDITIEDFVSPQTVDMRSVNVLLVGQLLLMTAAAGLCYFFGVKPLLNPPARLNAQAALLAIKIGIPMTGAAFLLDHLPIEPFKTLSLQTRMFVLRILGRNTHPARAALWAGILSVAAGVSEELAFRGFLFNILRSPATAAVAGAGAAVSASAAVTGTTGLGLSNPIALALTSAVFGFMHIPVFGASMLVETVLASVFGLAYLTAGSNLAVPIAVHCLYDFITIFITWGIASRDLRRKVNALELAQAQTPQAQTPQAQPTSGADTGRAVAADHESAGRATSAGRALPLQFESMARGIFDTVDTNHDGNIQLHEFTAGLRLIGVGTVPVCTDPADIRRLFQEADSNRDGLISYPEYRDMFRRLAGNRLSKPY